MASGSQERKWYVYGLSPRDGRLRDGIPDDDWISSDVVLVRARSVRTWPRELSRARPRRERLSPSRLTTTRCNRLRTDRRR